MTNKEIEAQKALGTYLSAKWKESEKLQEEADKLEIEGDKLYAKADKLWAKGDKLRAEAYKLYVKAVKEIYGPNVIISWSDGSVEIK